MKNASKLGIVKLARKVCGKIPYKAEERYDLFFAALLKAGFQRIGAGCYKSALVHPTYPKWVVKIFYGKNSYKYDSNPKVPRELKPFWLKPVYQNKFFVVQRRLAVDDTKSQEARDKIKDGVCELIARYNKGASFSNYDVHYGNCGMLDGRPVIYDYSL
jgi:hypothetical protein